MPPEPSAPCRPPSALGEPVEPVELRPNRHRPHVPLGPLLDLEIRRRDRGQAILILGGELCLATADELEERIDALLDDDVVQLALDMRQLRFLDSRGIRLLLTLDRRARQSGLRFGIVLGEGEPRRALELADLAHRLPCLDASTLDRM